MSVEFYGLAKEKVNTFFAKIKAFLAFFSYFGLRAGKIFLSVQTACQQGDDDDVDDSDQQAEYDAMLIEYAGDVLPSLASAVGGAVFAPYFAGFLPLLLKKTVSE